MEVAEIPVVEAGPLAETATIKRAAEALGLTEKAVRRKIEEGVWIEGRHYHRRGGTIWVDIPGVTRWVRQGA
jgi:hypothetical protein